MGNKYTNSPRIDGVEPKTKTASTEELPCASGGSKVVCICHSNLCICGEKSTKDLLNLPRAVKGKKAQKKEKHDFREKGIAKQASTLRRPRNKEITINL